jgi:hypothetical protein
VLWDCQRSSQKRIRRARGKLSNFSLPLFWLKFGSSPSPRAPASALWDCCVARETRPSLQGEALPNFSSPLFGSSLAHRQALTSSRVRVVGLLGVLPPSGPPSSAPRTAVLGPPSSAPRPPSWDPRPQAQGPPSWDPRPQPQGRTREEQMLVLFYPSSGVRPQPQGSPVLRVEDGGPDWSVLTPEDAPPDAPGACPPCWRLGSAGVDV